MKLVCVNREIVWCLCVCLGKIDSRWLLMDRGVLFEGWSWRGVVGGGWGGGGCMESVSVCLTGSLSCQHMQPCKCKTVDSFQIHFK